MPMHMIAYNSTVSAAPSAAQAITPVPDSTVTISGNLVYVPDKYNQVLTFAGIVGAGSMTDTHLEAPSLRGEFFPYLSSMTVGTYFADQFSGENLRDNPLQLQTNEGLEFFSDANNGATATQVIGLVVLSDGAPSIAKGKMFTMKCTASAALAVGEWVNSALTFDQTLPVGNYDIVGMAVQGTDLRAARLVFIGPSAVTRPGVLATQDSTSPIMPLQRYGNSGVYGSFNSVTPPSVDFLGTVGGTSQTVYLDLIAR